MVVILNFSKYGRTIPLRNKNAQILKDPFEKIVISSTTKPNLIETDRDKGFCNSIFKIFLKSNNIKAFSRKSSVGRVFAELSNRSLKDLLKKPVLKKIDGDWIKILPTITKQYVFRIHSSTKLTPIQASIKKNEGFAYKNLLNKRKKIKPKFQVNNFVRTADLKKTFSKEIRPIALINYIKLKKLFMVRDLVRALKIYQGVITKPC